MNEKKIDEWIDQILREEQTLPEGLSHRLEQQIDTWAKVEKKSPLIHSLRKFRYGWSAIAASLLLGFGLFQYVNNSRSNQLLTDTYSNPQEAELVAQKALLLISDNFNKGIKQINQAQKQINWMNQVIKKHLK